MFCFALLCFALLCFGLLHVTVSESWVDTLNGTAGLVAGLDWGITLSTGAALVRESVLQCGYVAHS
ncbi:hypothetical protein K432DRAFT_387653 [Lepidopterella palustris CBS 459.81]|uniref:Uncharacterized protein n=1 Tax=Lepidopterella palustris CBS 459.81 TaxID=1314670 RepID=A0A8E2DWF3_9PEZI|nr:hypothetical protein K432DRAFT_387653 [Lepidopterella palustris CBS 459.81]